MAGYQDPFSKIRARMATVLPLVQFLSKQIVTQSLVCETRYRLSNTDQCGRLVVSATSARGRRSNKLVVTLGFNSTSRANLRERKRDYIKRDYYKGNMPNF